MLLRVRWILVCCNKVATRGSCNDCVCNLNALDYDPCCKQLKLDWNCVGDGGKRRGIEILVGST